MVSEITDASDVRSPIQNGGRHHDDTTNLKLDVKLLDQPYYKNQQLHQQDVLSVNSLSSNNDDDDDDGSVDFGYDNSLALNLKDDCNDCSAPNVVVSNSTGIQVGNKNYYQGPVTIKKIVYAGKVPDVYSTQNGASLPNGSEEQSVDVLTQVKSDNKSDKPDKNNFMVHFRRLRYNKPLLITLIVCAIAVIGMVVLLFVFLHGGGNASKYPTDSDDQVWRPSPENPPDPPVLPPQSVKMISRREWLAEPPKEILNVLDVPVPYVILWHTATDNCTDQSGCKFLLKNIQEFHMQSNNWSDIGYNFMTGGDGYVYEGRGWTSEGAHTRFYNKMSIGIAFIGTFNSWLPPKRQLDATMNLIALGVNSSYIQPNYKLFAARQLSSTKSPGQVLYENIKTWPHWTEKP